MSNTARLVGPGSRVGGYTLERELGSGGMATVYLARHQDLGSRRAVKVLNASLHADQQLLDRFLSEAKIQANLLHPNVVEVKDVFSEPGFAAIVMEYIDGPTLQDFLKERGSLPWPQAVSIVIDILEGVGCAHASHVVHRDLKPSNVLLSKLASAGPEPVWLAKVCDFGIAKLDEEGKTKTKTGTNIGTIQYMSPEQIRDATRVDGRSDIWAVGTILYELLGGQKAFDGDSVFGIMLSITQGTHRDLRQTLHDVPEALHAIVSRALSVEPEQRFADCYAMLAALRALPLILPIARPADSLSPTLVRPAQVPATPAPNNAPPVTPAARTPSWLVEYGPSIVIGVAAACMLGVVVMVARALLFPAAVSTLSTPSTPAKAVQQASLAPAVVAPAPQPTAAVDNTRSEPENARIQSTPADTRNKADTKDSTCLQKNKADWFSECRRACGTRPACMLETPSCRCAM